MARRQQTFNHEDEQSTGTDLGIAYLVAGGETEALQLLNQALQISRAKHGLEHKQTLIILNLLAMASERAGRAERALVFWEESLRIQNKFNPHHPENRPIISTIARLRRLLDSATAASSPR